MYKYINNKNDLEEKEYKVLCLVWNNALISHGLSHQLDDEKLYKFVILLHDNNKFVCDSVLKNILLEIKPAETKEQLEEQYLLADKIITKVSTLLDFLKYYNKERGLIYGLN